MNRANRNAFGLTNSAGAIVSARFIDVDVETFTIRNADNNGTLATAFEFTNTGLTWVNVFPVDVVKGTRVTIDGVTKVY